MSPIKLVTGTTVDTVSRVEMKSWLRLEEQETAEDPLIDSLIALAVSRVEERTNRSGIIKTFDFYPDEYDDCGILIPKAPLVSVTAITGFSLNDLSDTGGTAMSTSGFYVDTANEFGRVMPLSAFTYPVATRSINPFIVRFTAGYSSNSTGVPESVKTEIKQLIALLYERRGDEGAQASALDGYRSELDLPTWG